MVSSGCSIFEKILSWRNSPALSNERQGKLALWQVIARVIDQGSRLSAVRLATTHACCDLLGLDAFNEDHLYANLAWLTENQRDIELRLFQKAYRLVQELALRWIDLDLTVGEGIKQLGTLCLTEVKSAGKVLCSSVPIPRPEVAELISRSGIALPMVIKRHGAKVATKKKLQNNNVRRS